MQIRNARYNAAGTIDCEVNHPDLGWIPFTASPDDPEKFGRDVYDEAIAGQVEPYVPPEPLPPPVPETISRRQFYQGLAVTGMISQAEALAAIKTATLPADLQIILEGMTDDDAKFEADMLLSGASDFNRSHPLVMIFAIQQGMSEQDVDDFWRLCAGL